MKKKNISGVFAANLVKARASAGFDTPYKFYHKNGGKRHFPFTFFHYTRVEKALALPGPESMRSILIALRLMPSQGEMRELIRSYLKDLLGGGSTADDMLNPLLSGVQAAAPQADDMRWMRQHVFVHMSVDEFMAVSAGEEAYWCAEALCSDNSAWRAPELAQKLNISSAKAEKALESLVKCGLVIKDRSGKYQCRHEGKFFMYPGRLEGMGQRLGAIKGFWEKSRGKQLFERQILVRSDPGAMANYKLALSYSVDASHAYATHTSTTGSGFYLVRAEIKELKKF